MGTYKLELSFEQVSTIEASLRAARRSAEADLARMVEIAGVTTRAERAELAERLAEDWRSEVAAITDVLEVMRALW